MSTNYALVNGIILDGTKDMAPQCGLAVVVEGKKIKAIVPETELLGDIEKIDLAGQYLMPGLINLHVHIPATGRPSKEQLDVKKLVQDFLATEESRAQLAKINVGLAQVELMSGVTTIRTVGGVEDYDSRTRDLFDSGKAVGPRIIAGNMAISVPGGHMAGSLAYETTSPSEAVELVDKIADSGADLIKLMITGGVLDATRPNEPGALLMSPAIIRAACDEAHRLGFKVAAHVEGVEGLKAALQNGVDTIEHGAEPDDEVIRLFQERGAAVVTTISPTVYFALLDPAQSGCNELGRHNGTLVFNGIVACSKACLAAGIPVGLGTDTGCTYVTHYDFWRELAYFVKYCGVSNSFALHTATQVNAQIAGIEGLCGTVEAGKEADLIVTKENPLEDLRALSNVSAVVARGTMVSNPKVEKYPEVETALDAVLA